MNINFQDHIPEDFNDNSKVWIYQSSRLFLISEAFEIEDLLKDFTTNWKSHGTPVKGYGNLFFGQFIVLMADETASGVSGCSTDSSVRLIKTIEEKFNVNMFDRQTLSFIVKERLQLLPLNQLNYAIENKFVDGNTLYFNNTVLTKKEFVEKWVIPAKDSWLGKKYSF